MTAAEPMATLSLSGTLLGVLRDRDHLPDTLDEVTDTDPDRDLHRAAARWHAGTRRVQAGIGWRIVGPATGADAAEIINYLHSVAEALATSGDRAVKDEAALLRQGLVSTLRRLRQSGAAVTERQNGPLTDYTVEVFDGAAGA